jgi:hypothetical protein
VRLKKFPQLITDNKLLIWLSRIPPRYRWIITLCIVITFLFLWSLLFVVPLFLDVRMHKKEIDGYNVQIAQIKKHAVKKIKPKKFYSDIKKIREDMYEVSLKGEFLDVLRCLDELKQEGHGIKKLVCKRGKGEKVEAILHISV